MTLTQDQTNQLLRAAFIYPFIIVVVGFIADSLSDSFLDAILKETSGPSEAIEESEPVRGTIPVSERRSSSKMLDTSTGEERLTSPREVDATDSPSTSYPPALNAGVVVLLGQLFLFFQMCGIIADLVRTKNEVIFKVIGGVGCCVATFMILRSNGKVNTVYASARAGHRAICEPGEWRFCDLLSGFALLVVMYSWFRVAWA